MFRGAFPAITTRQSFIDVVEIVDSDDGSPIDLTGCKIQVEIIEQQPYRRLGDYWPSAWGFGWPTSARLLATTDDGSVTIPDLGVFIFTFTPQQIASLPSGEYAVGCNMSRNGETVQLLLGNLPVLDGVVPQ